MERDLYATLVGWKDSDRRKPLIIRGVRQCGKTYLMKQFGEREFGSVAYLKFEGNGTLCSIFDGDLVPERLIRSLSIFLGTDITEDTLIIFDEIQECPRALTSLKAFCEDAPGYRILCAGSLLGLQGKGSFPVGKVSFLELRPMSFREFLRARNPRLCSAATSREPRDPFIVSELKRIHREYMTVGGMPEAVSVWIDTGSMTRVDEVLDQIDASYRYDFLKHVPDRDIKRVNLIWESLPAQLASENRRFFFGHAVKGARARDLEDAVQWLADAGMVYRLPRVSRPVIPLRPDPSESMFKLYMMDVGLLRFKSGVTASDIENGSADRLFIGGLTENFAMCELLAYGFRDLGYWADVQSEVDFLISCNGIVPAEVKASDNYRATSLKRFIDAFRPRTAVVLSYKDGRQNGIVLTVPLYSMWDLQALSQQAAERTPSGDRRRIRCISVRGAGNRATFYGCSALT